MKKILVILLFTLAIVAASPIPPNAVARICGNVVIEAKYKPIWKKKIEREGCSEVRFVPLEDDFFLAYGIKIITSESISR